MSVSMVAFRARLELASIDIVFVACRNSLLGPTNQLITLELFVIVEHARG